MGIIQKIEHLSSCGTLMIDNEPKNGQNWFKVIFMDSNSYITSEMPTLKQAILSIDHQLGLLIAKEYEDLDNWNQIVNRR